MFRVFVFALFRCCVVEQKERHAEDLKSPDSSSGMRPMGSSDLKVSLPNLTSTKVPDEDLTSEQLHRRDVKLAKLNNLKSMLNNGHNGRMMYPGMAIDSMTPANLMPPQSGMTSSGMRMPGGRAGHGGPPFTPQAPGYFESLSPAQHEWWKQKQWLYVYKRRKQEIERMRYFYQMYNMGPGACDGPFAMTSQGIMPGGLAGSGGPPFGLQQPPGNWNASPEQEWCELQQEFYMFVRFKQEMERMRHIHQAENMGIGQSDGTSIRGTQPCMPDPMSPTTSFRSLGPRDEPPLTMGDRWPGPVGLNDTGPRFYKMPDSGFPLKEDMVRPPLQGHTPMRAGIPQQFSRELLPSSGPGSNSPPTPFTHSRKRKPSGEDVEELYKKLHLAPSFRHECTTTKQLNMGYDESSRSPAQDAMH